MVERGVYCGGLVKVIDLEFGDPVSALSFNAYSVTAGTFKGRIVSTIFATNILKHLKGAVGKVSEQLGPSNSAEAVSINGRGKPHTLKSHTPYKEFHSPSQAIHLLNVHLCSDVTDEKEIERRAALLTHQHSYLGQMKDALAPRKRECYKRRLPQQNERMDHEIEYLPEHGPGALRHSHLAYCALPKHFVDIYTAWGTGPVRALYETAQHLYAFMESEGVVIHDRVVRKFPLVIRTDPLRKVLNRKQQCLVFPAFQSPFVAVVSGSGSLVLNVLLKNWRVYSSYCLYLEEETPVCFNGSHLGVIDHRQTEYAPHREKCLKVYDLRLDEVDPCGGEGESKKPRMVLERVTKGCLRLVTFWGSEKANKRIVFMMNKSLTCYNIETSGLVFMIDVETEVIHINGDDSRVLWVITANSFIRAYSYQGNVLTTIDINPAQFRLAPYYGVRSRVIGNPDHLDQRLFCFTADNGVFLMSTWAGRTPYQLS